MINVLALIANENKSSIISLGLTSMKHTVLLRHRKRLRKRHQSFRRMEFYSENLTPEVETQHVGACCQLPREFKKT